MKRRMNDEPEKQRERRKRPKGQIGGFKGRGGFDEKSWEKIWFTPGTQLLKVYRSSCQRSFLFSFASAFDIILQRVVHPEKARFEP